MLIFKMFLKTALFAFFLHQNHLSAYQFKSIEILLPRHADTITHAFFSPDSTKLITSSRDAVVRVFDVKSGSQLFTIVSESLPYTNVCFDETGEYLITMLDNKVELYNAHDGHKIDDIKDQKCPNYALSFDGQKKLQIYNKKTVLICDAISGDMESKAESQSPILHAFFRPTNEIITISPEGLVNLYNPKGQPIGPLSPEDKRNSHMTLSKDGEKLVIVWQGSRVRIHHRVPAELNALSSIQELKQPAQDYVQWLREFLHQATPHTIISNDDLIKYMTAKMTLLEAQDMVATGFNNLPLSCQNHIRLVWSFHHQKPAVMLAGNIPLFLAP